MGYLIKSKKFKEIYKYVEEAYNMSYVLRNFCQSNSFSEDLCHVSSLVEFINKKLDLIYSELLNVRF